MKKFLESLVILFLGSSVLIAASSAGAPIVEGGRGGVAGSSATGPSVWRSAKKCAVNSLYVVLRLNEVLVRYADVDGRLPSGEKGASFAEIRSCARSFGLESTPLKATPESLPGCPLPCIAHFEEERAVTGHYVVVTSASPRTVEFIDGTTIVTSKVPMEEFRKNWTGYILVFERTRPWRTLYVSSALLGALTVGLAIATGRRRGRPSGTEPLPNGREPGPPAGARSPSRLEGFGSLPSRSFRSHGSQNPLGGRLRVRSDQGRWGPLALLVLLLGPGILGPSAAALADDASGTPGIDDLSVAIGRQNQRIRSLLVESTLKGELIETPEVVRKYLGLIYLADETRTWAFKAEKRYYRMAGPAEAPLLAPGVDVDSSVLAGGEEVRERSRRKQDQARARREASATPADVPRMVKCLPFVEVGFDGRQLRRHLVDGIVEIEDHSRWESDQGAFRQDYAANLGLTRPDVFNARETRDDERLPELLSSGGFRVRPSPEDVDGASCLVADDPGRSTLWLDPKLGYAVRRWDRFDVESHVLKERRTNQEFREVEPGLWLPSRCLRELCGPPRAPQPYRGKPLFRFVLAVKELQVNDVPDSLFTLAIPPGVQVVDDTASVPVNGGRQPLSYIMPADPTKIDQVIRETRGSFLNRRQSNARSRSLLAVNLVVMVTILVLGFRYRMRASTPTGTPTADDGPPGP